MNDDAPNPKQFALTEADIKPLVEEDTACFATDMIVVENMNVAYMYREEPDFEKDSGWRFFAGNESPEYLSDPQNLGIYSLNTVANYDPDIVPLLNEPIGSEFERNQESGEFVEADAEDGLAEWLGEDEDQDEA